MEPLAKALDLYKELNWKRYEARGMSTHTSCASQTFS